MLLAIDVGNTNIVFAVFQADNILNAQRVPTRKDLQPVDYKDALNGSFDFQSITGVIISSVVPEVDASLDVFCQENFNISPVFVSKNTVQVDIKLERPEEVGADRLVNAVAVNTHYQVPAIVIDFGTATTFDVIDDAGAYVGGVIAPGIRLSARALSQAASKLPEIEIVKSEKVVGLNTVSAMQSGLYWGYASLIQGMIDRIVGELGGIKPFVIATGGLAQVYVDDIAAIDVVDRELTIKGLYSIYQDMKR